MLGDHAFVQHEIQALANSFDEVTVFNYTHHVAAPIAVLPDNVRYGGNLRDQGLARKLLGLLHPRNIRPLAKLWGTEAGQRSAWPSLGGFLRASVLGVTLANDSRLRKVVRQPGIDTTVYSFWGMGAGLMIPLLPSSVQRVFVRLHRYDLYEDQGTYLPFRNALFNRVDGILVISDEARRYVLQRYGSLGLSGKMTVSRLGSADPGPLEGRSGSVDHGLEPAVLTIVSCSNVTDIKRVDRIADALPLLATDRPVRWVHFGDGPNMLQLREKAAGCTADAVSVELRGSVSNDEIVEYYRSNRIDVFVNVSSSEGIPVSIMEAISCDIPVVATNVGGTNEIVSRELSTGELIPAEFSDQELAASILTVVDASPEAYQPKATWGRLYDARINSAAAARLVAASPET
ncbi:MAG: glycosyltransferase [Specibacter sp.]